MGDAIDNQDMSPDTVRGPSIEGESAHQPTTTDPPSGDLGLRRRLDRPHRRKADFVGG